MWGRGEGGAGTGGFGTRPYSFKLPPINAVGAAALGGPRFDKVPVIFNAPAPDTVAPPLGRGIGVCGLSGPLYRPTLAAPLPPSYEEGAF